MKLYLIYFRINEMALRAPLITVRNCLIINYRKWKYEQSASGEFTVYVQWVT